MLQRSLANRWRSQVQPEMAIELQGHKPERPDVVMDDCQLNGVHLQNGVSFAFKQLEHSLLVQVRQLVDSVCHSLKRELRNILDVVGRTHLLQSLVVSCRPDASQELKHFFGCELFWIFLCLIA